MPWRVLLVTHGLARHTGRMTRRARIGLAALGGVVWMAAAAAPARAFTLSETSAALGTANGLAASNGISGARTRGLVERRLGGIRTGTGLDVDAPARGFGSCGRASSALTPAKNWRRAGDPGARMRMTATWKRGGTPATRVSRVAWSRASDPSRCR
jgi:hypothetical protein